MWESKFTISGILSLIIILITFIRYRFNVWKLLTDPIFIICILYYKNFGSYKIIDFSIKNEFLLSLSFIIFITSYFIVKKTKLNGIDRMLIRFPKRGGNTKGDVLVSDKGIIIFFILAIIYCIVDIIINTIIFGSIENALIRFYSNIIQKTEYISLKNYLSVLYKLMVCIIFVYRYFLNLRRKNSYLFLAGVFLLILIAIPTGSRGMVLGPIMSLFLADIFSKRFHSISIKRHYIQYLYLGLFGVASFLILTSIRSIKFKSLDDVKSVLTLVDLSSSAEEFRDREGNLMITDTKLCFDKFGGDVEFLPVYYTAGSIAISWFPRALWQDKPVSFGLVINSLKNGKKNLLDRPDKLYYPGAIDWAAGVAGEGWANGGLLGLILYSILFGGISGKCAKLYYLLMRNDNNYIAIMLALGLYQMTYCFIRGSLQSTLTPSFYSLILLLIIIKFLYSKT